MRLLGFMGHSGSRIDRLMPIWAVEPPIHFELSINDMEQPTLGTNCAIDRTSESTRTIINNGAENIVRNVSWNWNRVRSSTLTLSDASTTTLGKKVSFGVRSGTKAGIPLVVQIERRQHHEVEVRTAVELGKMTTDGIPAVMTTTETHEETTTVRPGRRLTATAFTYEASAAGLKWNGIMTVTHSGGGKRSHSVNGFFDSTSVSQIHTIYTDEALSPEWELTC